MPSRRISLVQTTPPTVAPRKLIAPVPKPRRHRSSENIEEMGQLNTLQTEEQPSRTLRSEENQSRSDKTDEKANKTLESQLSTVSESSRLLLDTINMLVETDILQKSESMRSSFSSCDDVTPTSNSETNANSDSLDTKPSIVGVIPKTDYSKNSRNAFVNKKTFQIGASMYLPGDSIDDDENDDTPNLHRSKSYSDLYEESFYEDVDIDENMFEFGNRSSVESKSIDEKDDESMTSWYSGVSNGKQDGDDLYVSVDEILKEKHKIRNLKSMVIGNDTNNITGMLLTNFCCGYFARFLCVVLFYLV